MKQGLSLRTSQHLALTPQLQRSIRLLQLSTLELAQEVEQMLDDNPFLETAPEEAPREEFGLAQADAPALDGEGDPEGSDFIGSLGSVSTSTAADAGEADPVPVESGPSDWDGDGTTEIAPDDSEWGSDAPARRNDSAGDGDEAEPAIATCSMQIYYTE